VLLIRNLSALYAGVLLATAVFAQQAKRVVVFGVDGLSAKAVEQAPTPAMHQLIKTGIWTLHARSVLPTVSSPNWAAMIMGAAPDITGITSNDWQPDKKQIAAICQDSSGHPPTIFGQIRKFWPDAQTALFTDWPDFVRLVEPNVLSKVFVKADDARAVVAQATEYLSREGPTLLFIHVDHVDHAGHTAGWYGPEYFHAVDSADDLLAQVLQALEKSGLREETIVLLTADHGGHGKKHGAMIQQDIEIPWIASGPGLPQNREIHQPVSTTETAPTIVQWLGLTPDDCWLAHAVS